MTRRDLSLDLECAFRAYAARTILIAAVYREELLESKPGRKYLAVARKLWAAREPEILAEIGEGPRPWYRPWH